MPSLHVKLFAGRTVEQKRALAQALTDAVVKTLGGSPEAVDIVFTDVERHDWATAGKLWSDRAPPAPPAA
jgi:4-oxalocrotonate tautomerase